jgi:hypothetical protein
MKDNTVRSAPASATAMPVRQLLVENGIRTRSSIWTLATFPLPLDQAVCADGHRRARHGVARWNYGPAVRCQAALDIHTFRHEFKEACRAAGLPDGLRFHDLRGSSLKAFADAGCSELEIRAIFGHSMKSLQGALGRYIDPWRGEASQSAVEARENADRTNVPTDSANQA